MVISKVEEQRFRILNEETGDLECHLIDMGGNHFIGKRCVNPLNSDLKLHKDGVWRHSEIGDTYPEEGTDIYPSVIKIK